MNKILSLILVAVLYIIPGCTITTNTDTGQTTYKPDYILLGKNAAYTYYAIKKDEPEVAEACEIAYRIVKDLSNDVESYSDLSTTVSSIISQYIEFSNSEKEAQIRILILMITENAIYTIRQYLGANPLPIEFQQALSDFIVGADSVVSIMKEK